MKANLHPQWNHQATVTCACGATFQTGSQQDSITVDICSSCHPFFTGEMRFVDRQGRVDRFMNKMSAAQAKQAAIEERRKAKAEAQKAAEAEKKPVSQANDVLSYKQVLQQEQTKLKQAAAPKAVKAEKAPAAKTKVEAPKADAKAA